MKWIKTKNKNKPPHGEIVILSDGEGITCVGCRIMDDTYALAYTPLYEQGGEIVADCELTDFEPTFWHELPHPIKNK